MNFVRIIFTFSVVMAAGATYAGPLCSATIKCTDAIKCIKSVSDCVDTAAGSGGIVLGPHFYSQITYVKTTTCVNEQMQQMSYDSIAQQKIAANSLRDCQTVTELNLNGTIKCQ